LNSLLFVRAFVPSWFNFFRAVRTGGTPVLHAQDYLSHRSCAEAREGFFELVELPD
jgi:hypothetical protein